MQKKTCKKCNNIFDLSNFYFRKRKGKNYCDSYCKDCRKIYWIDKRQNYKLKIISLGYKSIDNYRKSTNQKYKETERKRSAKRTTSKFEINKCSDRYIKELIRKDKSLKGVQIPKELIELYRNNLLLKREIKKL